MTKRMTVFAIVIVSLAVIPAGLWFAGLMRTLEVTSDGMTPTLAPGDRVLVEGLSYLRTTPRRGDVIAFVKSPKTAPEPGDIYIRRIVGVSGDKVSLSITGRLVVNDVPVERPLTEEARASNPNLEASTYFEVPDKAYYPLDDHSNDVMESLFMWRYATMENIHGRVLFRFWPLDRIGLVR